jgi:hypothetical protein
MAKALGSWEREGIYNATISGGCCCGKIQTMAKFANRQFALLRID